MRNGMSLRAVLVFSLAVAILGIAAGPAQAVTYYWDNSNVTGSPAPTLDWFTGGSNPLGLWTGPVVPISSNANTIQFFANTSTALTNTATPSAQISNINNGGFAFELGVLTLNGLASATANANLTMTISGNTAGDALNFSAAAGTINLNALNATRTITYNLNSDIQLGTASSAGALTITGNGTSAFNIGGVIRELQSGGGSLIKSGSSTVNLTGTNLYTGTTTLNAGTLTVSGAAGSIAASTGITLNGGGLTLTNINDTEGAIDRVAAVAITSNGGTITYNNTATGTAYAETLGTLALTTGQLNVVATNAVTSGTETLTFGAGSLTHSAANTSAITFSGGSLGASAKNSIIIDSQATTDVGTIIGPWATWGTTAAAQSDYATYNITNGAPNAFGIQNAAIAASADSTWIDSTKAYTSSTGGALALGATEHNMLGLRNTGATTVMTIPTGGNLNTYGLLNGVSTLWTVAATGTGALSTPTGGGNLFVTTGSGAITISAPINDNGGPVTLVQSGSGTLTLSGTNTYSGGTVVNAGTLVASADTNLGAASGGMTFNGTCTFGNDGNWTVGAGRTITINPGANVTFNFGGATFAGPVVGSGTFTVGKPSQGNPALSLTNTNNTFTGAMNLNEKGAGGNSSYTFNSLGDAPGAGIIKLGDGASQGADFFWGTGAIAPLVLNYRRFEWGNSTSNSIQNNNASTANTITINTDLLITATGNRTVILGGSNTGANTFAGKIPDGPSGTVISFTKSGASLWILSGANTYTGKTTISAGTLSINSIQDIASTTANALGTPAVGANSIIDLASTGTLKYTGTGNSSNRVINLTTAAGGTFTLDASGPSGTFALTGGVTSAGTSGTSTLALTGTGLGSESGSIANGTVTNVAAVTKSGTGTWTLSGTNTYTGNTTISGGTLQAVPGTGLPGTSYLQLDGGVLQANGTFTRVNSTTAGGANFQWMSANGGGFAANGGKLTVTVNNDSTTEQVWGTAAANNGIWGILKFGSATANAETEFQNNINLAAATRTVDVAVGAGGDFATLSGVIRTASGTAGITKTGGGILNLTGANTYNGATTVSAGTLTLSGANGAIASSTGTLAVGTLNGTTGALTLDNAAANNADRVGSVALSLNNGTVNFIGNTSSASTETIGAITAASGSNLINLSGGASDQVAVLTSTGATITLTAPATINIVADNINQQFKLTGGAEGMLSKAIYFNSNDFAYLDLAGNLRAPAYGTDSGFEAVDTVTAGMHVKLATSVASQDAVSLKTLNLAGANVGITQLTGNLTFTNSATEGGIIKSGGGAAQIGTAGDAFDIAGQTGGELVFNTVAAADNLTLNVGIAASSTALTKNGAGTLTLAANRDYLYTGATNVSAGTLVLNSLNTDGFKSTAITVNNGGTARLGAADKVVNTALVTVNTGGALDMAGFDDSIGALAGSGSVTNSTGSSTLTLKSGTQTFSGVISGAGLTLKVDGASQTLSGTNTYGGGTVLNAGTLSTSADVNLGSGGGITVNGTVTWNFGGTTYARSLTVNDGAVLSINGNQSGARAVTGVLSGNGTVQVTSSDVVNFPNTGNTFTGTVNTGYAMSFGSLGDSLNPINFGSFTWTGGAKTFALRPFTLNAAGGATLASSGTGALTIQQPLAISGAAGARTLSLSGSYTGAANTFAGNIADGPGSVVSLTKSNSNSSWALSGTNTYIGPTTISFAGSTTMLIFQGMQALSPYTSLNTTTFMSGGAGANGIYKLLDDSATPASRSGVNLNFTVGENAADAGRFFMALFVGNNNTANGGSSAGTTTGSTIQLGNMNINQGAGQTTGGGLAVTGANGYKLQIANVNVSLQAAFASAWPVRLNPTSAPLIVGGNVQQLAGSGGTVNLQLDGTATGNLISGNILNSADGTPKVLAVTKQNTSDWTLSGTNTYTGNTTVSAGKLALADNAQLKFVIGASGTNNKITGTGTLDLAGDFNFDLAGAGATLGNQWQIVDVGTLAETYQSTFSVTSSLGAFAADGGGDKWTKLIPSTSNAYEFTESTGVLMVVVGLKPGDTNGDFVVDAADYIALKTNFGMTEGATLAQGNFDSGSDGNVDWDDLQILMGAMATRSVGEAPPAPEPATLGLLMVGALAVIRRRRK